MLSLIPDLDLSNLSLWLKKFNTSPVVLGSVCTTISTIPQNKLVLNFTGYFIDCDQVVFVVELADGWEVSVLLAAIVGVY